MRTYKAPMENKPEVSRVGIFDIQVCVPGTWTDDQVREFAGHMHPCGTESGWHIRKQGDKALQGCDERVPCDTKEGYVHIMLDA